MKSRQEIIDKLNQLTENEPNKWLEEADYRFENKAWRRKSQGIALKILSHIHAHGISQKDLAEKLNVSPQQVNKWVKGGENFTLETISRIENVLGIPLINVVDVHKNDERNNFASKIPDVKIKENITNNNKVYFENKLKRMNEILAETELPELYYIRQKELLERAVLIKNEDLKPYQNSDADIQALQVANEPVEKYDADDDTEDEAA